MEQTKLTWMQHLSGIGFAVFLLCGMLWPVAMQAQGDVEIIHECDTTWHFGYKGINLYARQVHRIDIAYPTVDAHGNAIQLSGSIIIPANIYNGSSPADGVLLYNRYTQLQPECCPTAGFVEGEMLFMCTPLEPNWILVESDFYGFGITADKVADQYYVYGDANGHASIDCLLSARQLLSERGIGQGKFLLNAGVSSGGYDCIAAQRVRDLYHANDIKFDKTVVAAAPFDVVEAYDEYIRVKDDPDLNYALPLMVVNAFNRQDGLGFSYEQMFREPLASHFDEWVTSGKNGTTAVVDSLKKNGMATLADCLQPCFLDTRSDEYWKLRAAMKAHDLSKGWNPDTTQPYYYQHYAHDKWVPCSSGRKFLNFLTNTGAYKKSLVPELTNLTTCMFVMSDSHYLSGIHYLLWLAATLSAYPVLYYDGELNTHYHDLIQVGTPMGIVKLLEEKGIDVGAVLSTLTGSEGGGSMDFWSLMAMLNTFNETLQEYGTNITEVLQIADDSGLSIADILEIINYLNAQKSKDTSHSKAMLSRAGRMEASRPFVGDYYYNYLLNWLQENNVDLNELKIGE